MKPFTILIKPVSADCNLHCLYCFYSSRINLYPETKCHRMPDKVLERLISSYLATGQSQYTFNWQGGEPVLMGLDFFRRAVEFQKSCCREDTIICNGLQTNATLIDNELATFLAEYKFLVGVSIDGPEEIHDSYRKTIDGRGSYKAVLRGMDCLMRNNVDFNALTLVTSANVKKAKQVYQYLCERGIFYHQYIPCVEFDNNLQPMPFTITGREWGDFLCGIFDEWVRRDTHEVSIRLFDSIVMLLVEGTCNICHMGDNCCQYFVVEYNGDVYPCDFFVDKDKKLGNIMDNTWDELQKSRKYFAFGNEKKLWDDKCSQCGYLDFCAGDCLKYRLYGNNNPKKISWLCDGWQQFYKHALPDLKKIAQSAERRKSYEKQPL